MKPFVKTLAASSLLVLSLSSTPALAAKIGVTMSAFDDNFLTVLRNGMGKYAESQKDISLQFEDAQGDVGKQLNQIQNFIAQKVDAIIVNVVDTDATPKMTKLATQAGIPLVYVNRMPADKTLPEKVAYVGSNEVDSGTLEMKEVCKLMGGKGNVSVVANIAPRLMHEMCVAAAAGDVAKAREIHFKLLGLHRDLFCEANPIPVKWAVHQLGLMRYNDER